MYAVSDVAGIDRQTRSLCCRLYDVTDLSDEGPRFANGDRSVETSAGVGDEVFGFGRDLTDRVCGVQVAVKAAKEDLDECPEATDRAQTDPL